MKEINRNFFGRWESDFKSTYYPRDKGRKLNVHQSSERLIYVQLARGYALQKIFSSIFSLNDCKRKLFFRERWSQIRISFQLYLLHYWPFWLNLIQNLGPFRFIQKGIISVPYFPVLDWNTEIYGVNLCIQSKYRKIRTRKYSVFGYFLDSFIIRQCKLFRESKLLRYFKPKRGLFW